MYDIGTSNAGLMQASAPFVDVSWAAHPSLPSRSGGAGG
jgi:hypothetical protein